VLAHELDQVLANVLVDDQLVERLWPVLRSQVETNIGSCDIDERQLVEYRGTPCAEVHLVDPKHGAVRAIALCPN